MLGVFLRYTALRSAYTMNQETTSTNAATASRRRRAVLVTGDVVQDHYIYEGQERRAGSTILLGTQQQASFGGAALLFDVLDAVAKKAAKMRNFPQLAVEFGLIRDDLELKVPNGYCLMRPYSQDPHSDDDNRVWRMSDPLGFSAAKQAFFDAAMANVDVLNKPHDVVVFDDAGISFGRWPSEKAWPPFLTKKKKTAPGWVILKLSSPITSGDLWHTLVTGRAQRQKCPKNGQDVNLLRRAVAIVSINDLRLERMHVAKALSWERAALDLVAALQTNPRLAGLRRCRFVVITFDTDGALLADFSDPENPAFRLIFDPGRLEGDFMHSLPGGMFGFQTCLTAAIVAHLPPDMAGDSPGVGVSSLASGVNLGLCAMRSLLLEGHGPADSDSDQTATGFPTAMIAEEILQCSQLGSYGTVTVPARVVQPNFWTIVAPNAAASLKPEPLWGLARRVALRGLSELRATPYLQLGKLFSIERSEIESLRSLQRLLSEYKDDPSADKPLSVAVFGPPGSGKSFCVKQLANEIFQGETSLLEFNLSQFEKPSQLIGLFHQVRDKVLEGKLPIIFWDEFDSRNLMWLQYLLAPMQDGKFQEGQVTHPIGKCVFVFAGGTCFRYDEFGQPSRQLRAGGSKEKLQEWEDHFVAMKGPDFKSRLAGYLNVLGPSQRDNNDITYPVRRALLLRFHLGKKPAKERLIIDPGLLTAFLEIDAYRHGARSIEKIAEQIRQSSTTGEFWRSDLPSRTQLDMHVDADKFLQLVEQTQ